MLKEIFKNRVLWIILVVLIVVILGGGYILYQKKKGIITVGGLFDLTGPTSDVGVDYHLGVTDAVRWINDHGGVNGKNIDLIDNDYGYDIKKAKGLYKRYINEHNVQMIQGWGTGDTEALRADVNKDSVVFMSASYSAALTDPFYTPYNFFVGTDYSTSIRLAIKYIKSAHHDISRPPKMIFIYPDHPYGRAPIPAGKRMAAELGIKYGEDQLVSLGAKEAIKQLTKVKEYNPDWVWLGGTLNSCAVIIRDAGKIGLDTKFIINTWGFDESLFDKAGDYANGRAYGVAPVAMWGDIIPGMRDIMDAHRRYRSGKTHTIHYVKGWLSMMVMAEGIKRAGNDLTGPGIMDALDTLRDFNVGDLSAPITFTARDHKPNVKVTIYKIEEGKCVRAADIKMPRDSRFLGW
ncbi:ABC transporter substrate-binding protein [bacterium]|nr:ABC transporter substrate-binding protein [bacterium]